MTMTYKSLVALVGMAILTVGVTQADAFFPHESESTNFPGPPSWYTPQKRAATPQQMRNGGYKQYNNVHIDKQRRVFINGAHQGNAHWRYNSQTGQSYLNFRTPKGGRIIRQPNGNVWVRPAQPTQVKPQWKFQQQSGGKYLGKVPMFWKK